MTNEDLEAALKRADAADRHDYRGLREVTDNVHQSFKGRGGFFKINPFVHEDDEFHVFVFFNLDRNIEAAHESGLLAEIEDAIYEELEKVGRGTRDEISVQLEVDSDENVQRNYNGSYFNRLR